MHTIAGFLASGRNGRLLMCDLTSRHQRLTYISIMLRNAHHVQNAELYRLYMTVKKNASGDILTLCSFKLLFMPNLPDAVAQSMA